MPLFPFFSRMLLLTKSTENFRPAGAQSLTATKLGVVMEEVRTMFHLQTFWHSTYDIAAKGAENLENTHPPPEIKPP